ncbi:helical backbone metal receptor [Aeromicrobium sp.]|uniref:helical backbone metal receptor n=1 Tax=Aeromicrobium sp. TaxID=1871063 RepID=UPI0035172AD1
MTLDDLGHDVAVPTEARRVVSLVPSITEGLAAARPGAVVGATDWCTHPHDLDVVRVRGTKNPDRAAVEAARPDLVVANQEENRELDVQRLRDAGVPVWVTRIETVDDAFASLGRLFTDALGWGEPAWLADARRLWSAPAPAPRGRVAVPIWRDPWMVVGPRTFTADLLRRLGWEVTTGAAGAPHERYPHVDVADLDTSDVDLVLLPDEPYVFGPDDGPEAFTSVPTRLVSGRLLTWYGPSLVEARAVLGAL